MKPENTFSSKMKVQWILAAVAGHCFSPIGLIWSIVNTRREAKHSREKNRVILFCGLGLLFVSVSSAVYVPTILRDTLDGFSLRIMALLYIGESVLGVYMIAVYMVLARRNRLLSAVYSLICGDHITSVSKISEITGNTRTAIEKSIRTLISMGELKNAHLAGDELILTESIWAHQRMVCPSCGAELSVNLGQTLTCAYCGSALPHQ